MASLRFTSHAGAGTDAGQFSGRLA